MLNNINSTLKLLSYTFIKLSFFIPTFLIISLLALPIFFDLIFSIFILFLFKRNHYAIIVLNSFILVMIFLVSITFGKNEKYGYFYRGHEKYRTKNYHYQKNINDEIFIPHGDIFSIDGGLDSRRELIAEPRLQKFITDSYGFRNDTDIKDADIILVGDSFIAGTGTSNEHLPSKVLENLTNKNVASLSYARMGPREYEFILNKYLDLIKKDAKIFVFYFEGNDFVKKNNKSSEKEIIELKTKDIIKYKLTSGYERLERNKDKFLLTVLSDKNYFLRNIRAKSHTIIKKISSKLYNYTSPIKYYEIKNKTLGFAYLDNFNFNHEYSTYIFENKKILNRVNAIFFVPTKLTVYSDYINERLVKDNKKFELLNSSYSKINIPVYDLSEKLKESISKYLLDEKYLYWRDDTHWNQYGILEAAKFVDFIYRRLSN